MNRKYYIFKGIFALIASPFVMLGLFIFPLIMGYIQIPGLPIRPILVNGFTGNDQAVILSYTGRSLHYNKSDEASEDTLLTEDLVKKAHDTRPQENTSKKAIRMRMLSINMDAPIVYGADGDSLLTQGFWSYPACAEPGQVGSACIFGHRVHHLPPAKDTMYFLDKVENGDILDIQYEDGSWDHYEVIGSSIHADTDFSVISQNTEGTYIKLITCANWDVWDERIVVTAKKV